VQKGGFLVVPVSVFLKAIANKSPAFLASAVNCIYISLTSPIEPSTIDTFLTTCTGAVRRLPRIFWNLAEAFLEAKRAGRVDRKCVRSA
jgi:hypothetical protein